MCPPRHAETPKISKNWSWEVRWGHLGRPWGHLGSPWGAQGVPGTILVEFSSDFAFPWGVILGRFFDVFAHVLDIFVGCVFGKARGTNFRGFLIGFSMFLK